MTDILNEAKEKFLITFLTEGNQLLQIPRYQRSFSWQKKQISEFFEDFIYHVSELNGKWYLGNFYTIARGDSKEILDDLYDKNNSDPEWKKKALVEAIEKDEGYYIFEFSNKGGLVMPIPLEITYEDGTKELIRIPVEVWRKNSKKTKWLKRSKLKITQAVIDPYWEIGDTQIENNYYPTRFIPARLKPRASRSNPKNLMQDLLKRNQVISSHN